MGVQRATWRLQRGSWMVMGVLILLALFGLFSTGPISTQTIKQGRLDIDYEFFQRNGAPTTMRLRLQGEPGGQARLLFGTAFLDAFRVEAVIPEPTAQRGGPDGVEMSFESTGRAPLQVYLTVRPESVGLIDNAIALGGEPPVRFTQFIYP